MIGGMNMTTIMAVSEQSERTSGAGGTGGH